MRYFVNGIQSAGDSIVSTGLDAARPAAGTAGVMYSATDTGIVYTDTGSAWRVVSAGGAVENLGISNLSAANYFDAGTGLGLGPNFAIGTTWAMSFYMGTLPGAAPPNEAIICWYARLADNADGYLVAVSGQGWGVTNQIGIYLGAPAAPAMGCIIPITLQADTVYRVAFAFRDAANIDYGLNGVFGTIAVGGNYVPPSATSRSSIGRSLNAFANSPPADFVVGAIVSMSTVLSEPQLIALTTVPASAERFRLPTPAGVTETFGLRAAHTVQRGASVVSGVGSVSYTVVGAPTVVAR